MKGVTIMTKLSEKTHNGRNNQRKNSNNRVMENRGGGDDVMKVKTAISNAKKKSLCFALLMCMIICTMGVSVEVAATDADTGTTVLDYLYSLRHDNISIYTIPNSQKVYCYGNRNLSGAALAYIAPNKYSQVTLLDVYKNGSKSSAKIMSTNGKSYWVPISVICRDKNFKIYTYQRTKRLTCYKTTSKDSKFLYLNYYPDESGKSKNDVTIIGQSGDYIDVFCGSKIFRVLKKDLFTAPVNSRYIYNISPKAASSASFGTVWYLYPSGKTSGSKICLKKLSTLDMGISDKYKFSFSYDNSTGLYTITNGYSGLALDVKGGDSSSGAVLQQYTKNNTFSQKFQIFKSSDGYYYIRSSLGTYVDLPGGVMKNGKAFQLYEGNGTDAQKFSIQKYVLP